MRNRLEQRLTELRNELAAGETMSRELDAKRAELQATMLRITGAIQVLEEMLGAEPSAAPPSARPTSSPPSNGTELPPG